MSFENKKISCPNCDTDIQVQTTLHYAFQRNLKAAYDKKLFNMRVKDQKRLLDWKQTLLKIIQEKVNISDNDLNMLSVSIDIKIAEYTVPEKNDDALPPVFGAAALNYHANVMSEFDLQVFDAYFSNFFHARDLLVLNNMSIPTSVGRHYGAYCTYIAKHCNLLDEHAEDLLKEANVEFFRQLLLDLGAANYSKEIGKFTHSIEIRHIKSGVEDIDFSLSLFNRI